MNVDCISPSACTDHSPLTAAVTVTPDPTKPESTAAALNATDTVSISNAGKTAFEELKETAAQTAQEAVNSGRVSTYHL
ncbi:MAG: hypothetical protein H8K03_21715 [Nitrospira sp.]